MTDVSQLASSVIFPNPYFPEFGQLIDDSWGDSVASSVIRRYLSTMHRDSDFTNPNFPPQNGQVIAIAPQGGIPYLQMYNAGAATPGWQNVITPSVDMNVDFAINGISIETTTLIDSETAITTTRGLLYVFAAIPHAASTTSAYIVPTTNAAGNTGAKLFVTDAIPAAGVVPHMLYTASTDFDTALGGTQNAVATMPFPMSGLTVGKKIWVCCWIPSTYNKAPALNGYTAAAATLAQLNLNSGPYRSVTLTATTDPTTGWPSGASTPTSPIWFGFT